MLLGLALVCVVRTIGLTVSVRAHRSSTSDVIHAISHIRMDIKIKPSHAQIEDGSCGIPGNVDVIDIADKVARTISGKVGVVHGSTYSC